MHFRPATPSDLPAIAALMNRAYRDLGLAPDETPGWTTETSFLSGDRTTPAALAEDLAAKPHAHLLVSGSPIETCVWLEPLAQASRTPALWYLGSLTVSPALQNSGLGRELLTAAEHFAATRGARTIQMTVINIRETLIAWYSRRGYTLIDDTHPFPYADTRFGTPLRPDLYFVTLEKSLEPPQDATR